MARLPTAALVALVLLAGALPAVALAKFTSAPASTATLSTGPLAPVEAGDRCHGNRLLVSWTAPEGLPPTGYTVWVQRNGTGSYSEASTVSATQLSAELSLSNSSSYVPAVSATYGSWKSPLSAPASKLQC